MVHDFPSFTILLKPESGMRLQHRNFFADQDDVARPQTGGAERVQCHSTKTSTQRHPLCLRTMAIPEHWSGSLICLRLSLIILERTTIYVLLLSLYCKFCRQLVLSSNQKQYEICILSSIAYLCYSTKHVVL